MTIIPSLEVGELGGREGAPAVYPWYWLYHLPSLAFWGLVVLPLVLVKENRRLQAWAILIPLGAVLLVFRMTAKLLAFSPMNAEYLGTLVVSLAAAWAILWLLAHWFARRHWLLTLVAAYLVMSATGLLSFASNCGLAANDAVVSLLLFYCAASFSLLLSAALTGRFRRKAPLSASFMVWLLPWTVLASNLAILLLMIGLSFYEEPSRIDMEAIGQVLLAGSIGGIAVYLLNLPFMLMAFRNRFYGQRLCAVLGLPCASAQVLNDAALQPQMGQAAEDEPSSYRA